MAFSQERKEINIVVDGESGLGIGVAAELLPAFACRLSGLRRVFPRLLQPTFQLAECLRALTPSVEERGIERLSEKSITRDVAAVA